MRHRVCAAVVCSLFVGLAACSSDTGPSGGAGLTARLAAGATFTCALDHAGAAFCWGAGSSGQLGNGAASESATPVRVQGGPYVAIAAGDSAVCAIRTDHHIDCWGAAPPDCCGQAQADLLVPTPLAAPNAQFRSVSVAGTSACAIDDAQHGVCWGDDFNGALGDGRTGGAVPPLVSLPGGHVFTSLDEGVFGGCGIDTDRVAWCWGTDLFGELGVGDSVEAIDSSPPVQVAGGLHFAQLTVGGVYTCGVTTSGLSECWGLDATAQLGDGDATTSNQAVPTPVDGGHFVRVFAGGKNDIVDHTCALDASGAASCWGAGGSGQLGAPAVNQCHFAAGQLCAYAPVVVGGGLTFTTLALGNRHTCGMVADGHVYCWGDNTDGQLGDGTTSQSATPVRSAFVP